MSNKDRKSSGYSSLNPMKYWSSGAQDIYDELQDARLDIANLQDQNSNLRAHISSLKSEKATILRHFKQWEKDHELAQQELKRVQELDFESRVAVVAEPHETTSGKFKAVFDAVGKWARVYFRAVDYEAVSKTEEFSHLQARIRWITWKDVDLKRIKFRFLVEAVVADIIAQDILLAPFGGCVKEFRDLNGCLYESMLKAAQEQNHLAQQLKLRADAQKLRSVTLHAYEAYGMRHGTAPGSSFSIEHHLQEHMENVVQKIIKIVGCCESQVSQTNPDELVSGCRNFVEMAGALAIQLGKLPAELKSIDKEWFDQAGRRFREGDDKMEDRCGSDDHDPGEKRTVNIIIRPGFLKYGNDAGENLDIGAVWTPATVETIIELHKIVIREPYKETCEERQEAGSSKDSFAKEDNVGSDPAGQSGLDYGDQQETRVESASEVDLEMHDRESEEPQIPQDRQALDDGDSYHHIMISDTPMIPSRSPNPAPQVSYETAPVYQTSGTRYPAGGSRH